MANEKIIELTGLSRFLDNIKTLLLGKKDKQTAVSDPTASGTVLSFIDTISQNANGEITATKKTVQEAGANQRGIVGTTAQTFAGTKTFTSNPEVSNTYYPSLELIPTTNGPNNRINKTVFEGSYLGAASFSAWNSSDGNDRRMVEVRSAASEAGLDNAAVLRNVASGTYTEYRIHHDGMTKAAGKIALVVSCGTVSSLPKTVNSDGITSDMVCVASTLGTPGAQTGNWTITTANGSLTISGTISGSTTVTLTLVRQV